MAVRMMARSSLRLGVGRLTVTSLHGSLSTKLRSGAIRLSPFLFAQCREPHSCIGRGFRCYGWRLVQVYCPSLTHRAVKEFDTKVAPRFGVTAVRTPPRKSAPRCRPRD